MSELNRKLEYGPWTFTKILQPNNQKYCYVITLDEVRNHYQNQTIAAKDVCCTMCNGDYDACTIGIESVACQGSMFVAFLGSVLNVPMRVNCTINVNTDKL